MCKLLAVCVLILALAWLPSTQGEARLLVSKTILNEYVVEGKELTVKYSIYNIGTSPAQSVTLEDNTFLPDEFSLVQGLTTVSWDKILHNTNISHLMILKPNTAGRFNISWATVTYSSQDGAKDQVAYSSAPGVVYVMPYADFSRKHDNHVMDWLAFVAMSAPTVLLPLLLWYRSYSKYEALKVKKA